MKLIVCIFLQVPICLCDNCVRLYRCIFCGWNHDLFIFGVGPPEKDAGLLWYWPKVEFGHQENPIWFLKTYSRIFFVFFVLIQKSVINSEASGK